MGAPNNPTPLPIATAIDNRFLKNTRYPTLALVAGVTALTFGNRMVTGDATGGVVTAQLPDAVANDGMYFEFKKLDASANAFTVAATGGQVIDTAPTFSLVSIQQAFGIVAANGKWNILYSPSTSAVVGSAGSTLVADGAFMTGGDFNPVALSVVPGTTRVINVSGSGNTHINVSGTATSGLDIQPIITLGIRVDGVDYEAIENVTEGNSGGAFSKILSRSIILPLVAGPHTISMTYVSGGQRSALSSSAVLQAAISILYPVAIGGGPVVGRSGAVYASIALAIAGEVATEVSGNVPQAGTVAGSLVGPGTLSAVDGFYKDWWIVNTSAAPSSGLAYQYARVSDYVGATRTFTLDKPWNFSAEATFSVIQEAGAVLKQDDTEDIIINKPFALDLAGNRLKGKIDVTAANFAWIRGGGGYVTNGIQKTDLGVLKVNDCSVSRRDTTIYAVLLTEAVNLGRCELTNCEFMGRVAGRRGIVGWSIYYCRNKGLNDSAGDIPYTLVESVGAVAVVASQFDCQITSEFSGACFYSENSITGPALYMSLYATLWPEKDYAGIPTVSPGSFAIAQALTTATLTFTTTGTGAVEIERPNHYQSTSAANAVRAFSVLSVKNFTGTANIAFSHSGVFNLLVGNGNDISFVLIEGASNMTGSVTLGGTILKHLNTLNPTVRLLQVNSVINGGSVTISGGAITVVGGEVNVCNINAFDVGATVTISVTLNFRSCIFVNILSMFGGTGTYTISGAGFMENCGLSALGQIFSSGGTATISNNWNLICHPSASQNTFFVALHSGTGGTLTVSGTVVARLDGYGGIQLSNAGVGTTAIASGPITITGLRNDLSAGNIAIATGAAASAQTTGAVIISLCVFTNSFQALNSSAGASVSGPTSLIFESCTFENTLITETGGATFVWVGATLLFKGCHVEGLFTIVLTRFTTVQAFHTHFNGASGNKSISASGTRPTTYRYWVCSFAQRYDDILPEILNTYDVLPAQAALVQGQPVKVNTANQYQVCVAASIVDGVLLAAAGAAGTFAVVVRQGRVFVAANAGVANGDNLALDLVTPAQANTSPFTPGQNIGTALEAAGTTIAGKAYAAVSVR
jgi:hypothetical protein